MVKSKQYAMGFGHQGSLLHKSDKNQLPTMHRPILKAGYPQPSDRTFRNDREAVNSFTTQYRENLVEIHRIDSSGQVTEVQY